jgi:hypothetical protein
MQHAESTIIRRQAALHSHSSGDDAIAGRSLFPTEVGNGSDLSALRGLTNMALRACCSVLDEELLAAEGDW